MKILIADDSPTVRKILENHVLSWGYDFISASDGLKAWEIFQQENPPKVALLDWMMPGMNGIELCRQLKGYEGLPYTYIILITGKTEEQSKFEGLEAGADDFITKPFDPDELKSRLIVAKRLIQYDSALSQKNIQLMEQNNQLIRLNELKNKFLGIAAHDLRNPLVSIRGIGELFLNELFGPLNEEQKENLQMIVQTSQGMLNLVNDLLDVSVIEQGTLRLEFKDVSLKSLLEERIKIQRVVAENKQMKLVFTASSDPMVSIDPQKMAQVIDNLIGNAIKFSPHESRIYIDLTEEEYQAVMEFRDEGPGISESDQKKMFGEFQKLSNKPTGGETSTGLGLAIVKKIIDGHKGVLELKSKVGEGSTFKIKLKEK